MRHILGARFSVLDNSGIQQAKVIGLKKRKNFVVGLILLFIIKKKLRLRKNIKKTRLFGAVTTLRSRIHRPNGDYFMRLFRRGLITFNVDHNDLLASRVFSPLLLEALVFPTFLPVLRYFKYVL